MSRPKFPTYHGPPFPEILNPWNPRHYLLLLTWIYFQPSRLKHYLYKADSDLYIHTGFKTLFRTLRIPAYRNLYLMSAISTVLLAISMSWIVSAIQNTPINWIDVAVGVAVGVAFGVAMGVGVSVVFVVTFIVALGAASGVAVGFGFSVVGGIVFGVVFGVMLGVVGGMGSDVAGGVAYGVAFGVAGGMVWGVAVGVTVGITVGVAGVIGGSRFIFHAVEFPLALLRAHRRGDPFHSLARHPAVADELPVWPLPGVDSLLSACLDVDLSRGITLVVQVAANPFQRWAVQCALTDSLTTKNSSLSVLYALSNFPELDEYLLIPVDERHFREFPDARLVLLGEIGQVFVNATGGYNKIAERLVWWLTRRLRRMTPTPLSHFSAMLYELFRDEEDLETIALEEIKLSERFEHIYEGVRVLLHGDEVADTYAAISSFLETATIESLSTAQERLTWLLFPETPSLRPPTIETFRALNDVSQMVAQYQYSTNQGRKVTALSLAAGALQELTEYVKAEVGRPERVLLGRVVDLWASIVAEELGRLGEAALQAMTPAQRRTEGAVERTSAAWSRPAAPFDNPYIAGDPVYPPLFVGRKDVFDRLGEVWAEKENPDSVILYGHRRMGKSSILRNLDQVAPPGSLIAYVDLAGETSFVESTAGLLLGLADRLSAAVRRAFPESPLAEPDPSDYQTQSQAARSFSRLADAVHDALPEGGILILALDEFEAVEIAVEEDKIGKEIYQFLRTKTQEPWLTLVFGGLHTLDEMSRDYQQPFYGSYDNIRVSYLLPKDTERLITNPTEDFSLNYEPLAVQRIIAETGGQPYLVQQVCRDALNHLNHELFDLGLDRAVEITLADVEAVLDENFFRRGTVYFDGVWTQAASPAQRTLLQTIAQRPEPWPLDELIQFTGLEAEILPAELRWAERHDILKKTETDPPTWTFHVPLMRRWIRRLP